MIDKRITVLSKQGLFGEKVDSKLLKNGMLGAIPPRKNLISITELIEPPQNLLLMEKRVLQDIEDTPLAT
jgi:hypothetical protein